MMLLVVAATPVLVWSQQNPGRIADTERVLREKELEWQCGRSSTAVSGPEHPLRTYKSFVCRRYDVQTIFLSIVSGESKEDAVKLLDQAQVMVQNYAKPQQGVGDQAYRSANAGYAWIIFRRANVFVRITVFLVDSRSVYDKQLEKFTSEADKIAKRFALHIADLIPAN